VSIDTALYSLVTTLAGVERFYPPPIPDNPTYPLATYMQVSGLRGYVQEGADGLVIARFQVDSWALQSREARTLAEEIRVALSGFRGDYDSVDIQSIFLIAEQKLYDDDAKAHRVIQDYRVTFREAMSLST
jgi:hypothetical protein